MAKNNEPTNQKIACLGWGSLIWNPAGLPLKGEWQPDGPELALEFARKSQDGRMTLVVCEQGKRCRTLWAELSVDSLAHGVEALRVREGTSIQYIGFCEPDSSSEHQFTEDVGAWARSKGLAGVVWTALPPKSPSTNTNGDFPSLDDVLAHLRSLDPDSAAKAAEYITRAPEEIQTAYRARIERLFSGEEP